MLEKFSESFEIYYRLKADPDGYTFIDETNSTQNQVESNYLNTFGIKNVLALKPKTLLENFQTATDLSAEQKLSTKWKFDDAEIWETNAPSQIIFNPVYPIYAICNTSTFASFNYEFAIYSLPGQCRRDRGQILFKRTNKEFKGAKGKTIVVWSSDGIHLCVIDCLEHIKTKLTFYRYFSVKGAFKQVKNLYLEYASDVNGGWNPWFDAKTILVPFFSLNARTIYTTIQGVRFRNNCSYEMFQITPQFDNIPFKGGYFSPCANGKNCFIVSPCCRIDHKHDTVHLYDFLDSPKEIARLHIPGVVHAYTPVTFENKLILMVRGNRHHPRSYIQDPNLLSPDCPLSETSRTDDCFRLFSHLNVERDRCYSLKSEYTNYFFIIIDLKTMDAREMESKLTLPVNMFGITCDDSVNRYKTVGLSNILTVSKDFLTVITGQRNFYLNRKLVNNMVSRTGSVKILHPTMPMLALRTGTPGYLDKQTFSFYLTSSADFNFRHRFPKVSFTLYAGETHYTNINRPMEINSLSDLIPI